MLLVISVSLSFAQQPLFVDIIKKILYTLTTFKLHFSSLWPGARDAESHASSLSCITDHGSKELTTTHQCA